MKLDTSKLKENIKKALKRRMSSGQSTKFVTPPNVKWWNPQQPGIYKIDIIPYVVTIDDHPDGVEKGDLYWYMPYKEHRGIGSSEKTFVCPTTFRQKCPICDLRAQLISEDYEGNKETIDALKARERCLIQVVDLDDRDAGVQLWDVSRYLFVRQLEIELNSAEDEDVLLFPDLKDGYTLKVRFIEEKLGQYSFLRADRIDFLPRKHKYDESIIEQGYQLDQMLRRIDPDLLYDIYLDKVPFDAVFDQDEYNSDSSEEEKEVVVAKKPKREKAETKPKRKKKAEPEPEPEEEEDEEDINDEEIIDKESDEEKEEEQEEEKPEPKPRRRRKEKDESSKKMKCPFGHVFGRDADKYDDCDDCPDEIWEKCSELSNQD